ncbi:MAG: FHIPEP family type III secretion protein, partial [Planctomycetes bacterium]|nr:FHIPEP family type III secretion protein [Planctomycetota bacterium]
LEALGENASKTKNAVLLTEVVRKKLARTITEQNKSAASTITAITFDPSLEHHLISSVNQSGEAILLNIAPEMAMEINSKIIDSWKSAMDKAFDSIVLLCDARIRSAVRNMIERSLDKLPVLAYDEIVTDTTVEPIETVNLTETSELLSSQQQVVGV